MATNSRLRLRRADVILLWLAALALVAVGLALALSRGGLEGVLALLVMICARSLTEAFNHSIDVSRATLALPIGIGFMLAAREGLRLSRANHRWTRFFQSAQHSVPEPLNQIAARCGLRGQLVLVPTKRRVVFTQGWLRPRVWVSTGLLSLLDESELEAVLRHEAHHVHARDPLKLFFVYCLARGLFFVPVARDLARAYFVPKEIAADEPAALESGRKSGGGGARVGSGGRA